MTDSKRVVDIHTHVGIVGDGVFKGLGSLSAWYRKQLSFKIFLLYAGVRADQVTDQGLHAKTIETISTCGLYGVTALALDHVFEENGTPRPDLSHVWVSNEYVLKLQQEVGAAGAPRVFFGCSVHPFDRNFRRRVQECVDNGAAVIKWLPSAQQFTLSHPLVLDAMKFLATAKHGKPLPLLLHTGAEYAIPTSQERTTTNNFLSWSWLENTMNRWPFKTKYDTPNVTGIRDSLLSALRAGTTVIFAHCGTPYFASGILSFLEHGDHAVVKSYLDANARNEYPGRCYADVSAFCTPFRKRYFDFVRSLPPDYILYGSDFPTPAFELSMGGAALMKDLENVLRGNFKGIIIPQGNLLDVNYRELRAAFGPHPMFENFWKVCG
jgi:predicted TIM-barrel fold metal-dependent hydrolase